MIKLSDLIKLTESAQGELTVDQIKPGMQIWLTIQNEPDKRITVKKISTSKEYGRDYVQIDTKDGEHLEYDISKIKFYSNWATQNRRIAMSRMTKKQFDSAMKDAAESLVEDEWHDEEDYGIVSDTAESLLSNNDIKQYAIRAYIEYYDEKPRMRDLIEFVANQLSSYLP